MPKKTEPDANDGNVTAQELLELLVITEPDLARLSKEGVLLRTSGKRNGRICNLYNWRVNVPRFCTHQRAPSIQARDEYVFEKRLTQQVVRAQKELELQFARGELVKRSRVVQVMTNLLAGVKNKVLGIPARCSRPLLGQTNIHKVNKILSDACRGALVDASNLPPDSFDEPSKNGQKGNIPQSVKSRVAGRRR